MSRFATPLNMAGASGPASQLTIVSDASPPPTVLHAKYIFKAAGGITWATIFGTGGYQLGEGIRRIAGTVGWALLALAVVIGFVLWRYYKKHEETLLAKAEREMARQA
jgi:hypothetical protein